MMDLMPTPALSHDLLTAALAGLELQKKTIEEHILQVQSLLGTAPKKRGRPPKNAAPARAPESAAATVQPPPRKRRKMGAAARKRMAEAMKKRWAAARRAGQTSLG